MFALNLGEDGRVLSATFDLFAPEKQPRIQVLPQGNLMDYRFNEGDFVYDPLPEEETPIRQTLEERIARLEKASKDMGARLEAGLRLIKERSEIVGENYGEIDQLAFDDAQPVSQ